jgi:hypothetical protein
MAYTISLEFYQQIEEKFGKELATQVAKTVESGIQRVEEEAKALAVQKKTELKEELTKELASKADIAELRGKMDALDARVQGEIRTLREEMKTQDTRLQGEMKTMNLKINFIIGLMILALTAMNPVVAELLKRWLKL